MLYFTCILTTAILAFWAEKNNNRKLLFLIALILSLFCGLRSVEVGQDTLNYYNYMYSVKIKGISFGSDIGFSVISYCLMLVFDNPSICLLIFAFLTNYLIIFRLWDFKGKASLITMILIYIIIHYPYTFNIVRQYLAIAIIFWATRYLDRGKIKKYIVCNIIAASFHTSALICFVYLFIRRGFKQEKKKKNYLGMILGCVGGLSGMIIFNSNLEKYALYFELAESGFHAMTIFKIICIFTIIFLNKIYSNSTFSKCEKNNFMPMNTEIINIYLLGLGLSGLGMLFPFMNRVGFYFMMYEMPFWGQVVRAKVNKKVYILMISFILIYHMISIFWFDIIGLNEYATFFMK